MIGLDTNILVRYLAQDDEKQSKLVTKLIEKKYDKDNYCFINHIVLCELVWVLQGAYKVDKQKTINIIEQLLHTSQFTCQAPDIIWSALKNYRNGSADFADYITSSINKHQGCEHTLSFDKKALKRDEFISPSSVG
jgi:predicted nucleic-acid-binding protein